MDKIKFYERDILNEYWDVILGREIYKLDADFELPNEFKRDPNGFLNEKAKTGEIKRTVYEGDRSTIFEWRQGNRNLYIKRMQPTTNVQMVHDLQKDQIDSTVRERGKNEIYSSSNAQNNRLIRTSAEVILGGIKLYGDANFFIAMRQYPPGVFLDDFLKTKGHVDLPFEEMKRIVIEPLADTLVKLHGTMDECGMMHTDLHPGNIYLLRPRVKYDPMGNMVIDWELVDRKLKPKKISWEQRMTELNRFVETTKGFQPPWKETFDQREFDYLLEAYEKRLE
ncbi:MAG: hypothetical protein JW754_01730 [Candidatus Aenigmarchaeota archaeon]|nr:hypothetical protein [Candidatus Aenigmarchaeota archaeon]